MEINKVVVGDLETNCYILSGDNKCIIIDPGADYDKIINNVNGKTILAVIITHSHFDHIGALSNFNSRIVYNRSNLEEKEYALGPFKFEIIYTPGHKDDSITIYFKKDKVMFTGDFIFKDSIGRMDLDGGSIFDMKKSLNIIKLYDKDILIYPGHGDNTILGSEIKNNESWF